jgi:hypothetical protein
MAQNVQDRDTKTELVNRLVDAEGLEPTQRLEAKPLEYADFVDC